MTHPHMEVWGEEDMCAYLGHDSRFVLMLVGLEVLARENGRYERNRRKDKVATLRRLHIVKHRRQETHTTAHLDSIYAFCTENLVIKVVVSNQEKNPTQAHHSTHSF